MYQNKSINGIRAIALLSVIFYHTDSNLFPGGFIGVDIFFVISGYLIGLNILKKLEDNKFSLLSFYQNRVVRIIPSLLFSLTIITVLSSFILIPFDLNKFGLSLISVLLFFSNFLFWQSTNYFDSESQINLLLHTWSLSLEVQFYFLLPIFLLFTWKLNRKFLLHSLVLLFLASYFCAYWAFNNKPVAAFYLLPTRAWEFLIGIFAAYYKLFYEIILKDKINEILSIIGLLLFLIPLFIYTKNGTILIHYIFTSTIGVALVIIFAKENTFTSNILSIYPLNRIGLISYSVYLLHYPLMVLSNYLDLSLDFNIVNLIVIFISFALGIFCWYFIEKPYRTVININRYNNIYFFLGVMILISIGLFINYKKGFEKNLTSEEAFINSFQHYNYKKDYGEGLCFLTPDQKIFISNELCYPSTLEGNLIWGDSHAAALLFGFRRILGSVNIYTMSACPPFLISTSDISQNCREVNHIIIREIEIRKPNNIFLHANWSAYQTKLLQLSLEETIISIQNKSPKSNIFIIGVVPQYLPNLPLLLLRRGVSLHDKQIIDNEMLQSLFYYDKILSDFSRKNGVSFISAINIFCKLKSCIIATSLDGVIMPVAWDYGHLTSSGSLFLSDSILKNVDLN
jgi:peptidoglycan/LPS O-acetylase OafA/YrhL